MKKIIFVCLGNICRSPIAEGCARAVVMQKGIAVSVSSAGTGSWHVGEAPCDNSIKVCGQNGIDISSQRAVQFQKKDVEEYDLVVALDDSNFADLKSLGVTKLVKLGAYGYDNEDVPDPYFFKGFEGFDRVFSMIDECVKNLFEEKVWERF